MNVFQLVLKQMRQRALSTWLTLLSVLLGVALAVAIMTLYREGSDLVVQKNYGYEVIVGAPKGSPLQLVMNTVYGIDQSPGNVPYAVYEDLMKDRALVKIAVPWAVGDTYKGYRIIGTLPKLFGVDEEGQPLPAERVLEYQPGKRYELAQGRVFHPRKFEAVIGREIVERTGLRLGDKFKATHGAPQPGQIAPDEHDQMWEVVGILKPTRTAADRALYIPLVSFYAISEHEEGLEAQAEMKRKMGGAAAPIATARAGSEDWPKLAPVNVPKQEDAHDHDDDRSAATTTTTTAEAQDDHDHAHEHFSLNPDGTINLGIAKDDWQISAILVKGRSAFAASSILYRFKMIDLRASAVNPAEVMRQFFDNFMRGTTLILLVISLLVIVVAAVGILVAIYNSVSARMREIAILRALGATRVKILALICLEAGMIGLIGAVVGIVAGHGIAAGASVYLNRLLGQGIRWYSVGWFELWCLLGVAAIAVLAGLVPALKAYKSPVATNLVAA